MKYYIDCEFDGHGGPLLSIAMVSYNGPSIHIRTTEIARDQWVIENVVPLMDRHDADMEATLPVNGVGEALRRFINMFPGAQSIDVIADSPVDIGRFCQAISTGEDGGWASTEYPRIDFEVHNVDCYPTTLEGAVQHNAWWDAMALREKLNQPEQSI